MKKPNQKQKKNKKIISQKLFVDFLDEYAVETNKKKHDYSFLISLIRYDYLQNQLYDPSLVGLSKHSGNEYMPLFPSTSRSIYNTEINPNPFHYYMKYSDSIWNVANTNQSDMSFSLYSYYRDFTDISGASLRPVLPKEYVHIDVSMQNIKDILSIIETYPYDIANHKEYNIDLKSLHNIKTELQELHSMIGMENLKQSVLEQLLYFIQELHIGNKTSEFKHTALFGSPGTGKTEIAKIIGRMYSKLGILKSNVFKKVTRNDLIAGYLGQTALKTRKVIDECLGGVLFIDEAYSLSNGDGQDSYSKECIDTICEALSDHKENLMVIIAGYEEELNETFFKMNKGLPSRFIWRFTMDPYTSKELMCIFQKMVAEQEWCFLDDKKVEEKWFQEKKDKFVHYGRDMELLLTYTKISHGRRIYGKSKELRKKISMEDMNEGYKTFLKNRKSKKEPSFMHSIYV